MKILVTGFEPFNKSSINPSAKIVEKLPKMKLPGVDLITGILPVDYQKAPGLLQILIEGHHPQAVICLGEANGRSVVSLERVGLNLMDFRIPDNNGIQVDDTPVIAGAPSAYFSTLPLRKIYNAIKEAGIPVELSLSAGSYLCNQVLFSLLHLASVNYPFLLFGGFIHVPSLPEQVIENDRNIPSMSLETSFKAVQIAVEVSSKALMNRQTQ